LSYPPIWQPLGRGAIIYFATIASGVNNAVYANIAFRRAYMHQIPDKPRQNSSRHQPIVSRRSIRMIEGLSLQHSGYKNMYPERVGGQEHYTHTDVPATQDVSNLNPLTHEAGIRGRRGR
jgi:hypothetical protein